MTRAIPRRPEPEISAPPLVVVERGAASPPLSHLACNALADLARGPMRLERKGTEPGVYRGKMQAHLRQTIAGLLLRGLATPDEDREGPFIEITPAGLDLIEPQWRQG